MLFRLVLSIIAASAFTADFAMVRAEDAVTVKIRRSAAGDKSLVTSNDSMETTSKMTIGGKTEEKVEKTALNVRYKEEVLALDADGKRPTSLRRTYEKAEQSRGAGKAESIPFGEKPIDIKLNKDGKYEFSQDGKPLPAEAQQVLQKEFANKKGENRDEEILPKTPVKTGDTWTIDIAKAAADLAGEGAEIDFTKSKATGKLLKVYDKGGKTYGVIEVSMELAVTQLKAEMAIPLKKGSTMKLQVTLDGCIDGSEAAGKSVIALDGQFDVNLPGLDMTIFLKGNNVGEKTPLPK